MSELAELRKFHIGDAVKVTDKENAYFLYFGIVLRYMPMKNSILDPPPEFVVIEVPTEGGWIDVTLQEGQLELSTVEDLKQWEDMP